MLSHQHNTNDNLASATNMTTLEACDIPNEVTKQLVN